MIFRLAVSRRRTRIDSHVSRKDAKAQRGGTVFSFSSQPEAYQDSIPMSHAKAQREPTGAGRTGSHAKEQRRKGRNGFSFSSQPEAYQDSIPMSHAKA